MILFLHLYYILHVLGWYNTIFFKFNKANSTKTKEQNKIENIV